MTHRFIDESLHLVRIDVGIARLDVLNGAVKSMGAAGLIDVFREIAFLHALGDTYTPDYRAESAAPSWRVYSAPGAGAPIRVPGVMITSPVDLRQIS